jgi:hypothetical protein
MERLLGESIAVSTAPDYSVDSVPTRVILHNIVTGHKEEKNLAETVSQLTEALRRPELADDPVIQAFFGFLKSMYPKDQGTRILKPIDPEDTEPGLGASQWLLTPEDPWPIPEAYIGPTLEVMGTQLPTSQLAEFTYYVFTNTRLEGDLGDPRQVFLQELREQANPPSGS